MGIVPDYSLHAFDAVPLLPQLPSSLQYTSVQGNTLAIMTAAPAKKNALEYATTMIGYPSTYNTADIISSIITAPGSFTAPTNLPNYTFTGLAAGAALPIAPSGFRHDFLPVRLVFALWSILTGQYVKRERLQVAACALMK